MSTQQLDYRRYYSKWHTTDDAHFNLVTNEKARFLENHLGTLDRSSAILDIGCGMGFYLGALKKLGFTHIKGVDADPGQVECCLKRGLPVQLVDYDGAWMSTMGEAYDVIMAYDLIEHIPKEAQMEFCRRVLAMLKAGGIFIGTVPNAHSSFAGTYRWGDWTHNISFTTHSLDFVLWHGGFRSIMIEESEIAPRYPYILRKRVLWWWVKKLFRVIRRIHAYAEMGDTGWSYPLSLNLLFVARK